MPILGSKLRKEFKDIEIKTVFTSGANLKSILCQNNSKLLPNSYQIIKSNLSKNYQNRSMWFPKQNTNFLPPQQFINNKTRCTCFNPLMPSGSKRSSIIKQTYSQKLLFIVSMDDLLLPPSMRVLKGGIVKKKSFCEFLILVLFKETLIVIQKKKRELKILRNHVWTD